MKTNHDNNTLTEGKSIDLTIRLLLIVLLLAWCAMILLPFLVPILWGIILAITLYPLYMKLMSLLKGRKTLASTILTILLLVILIVPSGLAHILGGGQCQGIDEFHSKQYPSDPASQSKSGRLVRHWRALVRRLEDVEYES